MSDAQTPIDFADLSPEEIASRIAEATPTRKPLRATPYRWPDPKTIPTRQWLFGHWLLKGEVTAIIAPGGTGKSTISNLIALSLASGKPLLEKPLPRGAQAVWVFNLEDDPDDLERQLVGSCSYYGIGPNDCGERIHLDSGMVQPLCTATEDRDGFTLEEEAFAELAETIRDRSIAAIIVDPFVSSHRVRESSNEAIDAVAKRWKRLAYETGCAVVLVHHTRKLGDRDATAEDGRGASALPAAARVVLTLNSMARSEAKRLGIDGDREWQSLVRIDLAKANRSAPEAATWVKLESQDINNGGILEPSDKTAVARLWRPPAARELAPSDIRALQERVAGGDRGENCQANDWVGHDIAEVFGLCAEKDKPELKRIQSVLTRSGYLQVEHREVRGRSRPFVIPGKAPEEEEAG